MRLAVDSSGINGGLTVMKADLNIYALFYAIKIALAVFAYRGIGWYRFDYRIYNFFLRKLFFLPFKRAVTWTIGSLLLCTPFWLIGFVTDIFWLAVGNGFSFRNLSHFFNLNLERFAYFAAFIVPAFIFLHQFGLKSEFQRRLFAALMLIAMATVFTLFDAQIGTFHHHPGKSALPDGKIRSGITRFLHDTNYSELALELTGNSERNAAALSESIVVTKGLVETLDQGEINTVIAHEIGHLQNGDRQIMALLTGLIFCTPFGVFASLWIWNNLFRRYDEELPQRDFTIRLPAAAALFIAMMLPAKIFWTEVIRLNEIQADIFAVKFCRDKDISPQTFVRALTKTNNNLGDPTTATYLLFFDHPTLSERIEKINEFPGN